MEGSAQAEHSVVGQLWRKPLDGQLNHVALFRDKVVPPGATRKNHSIGLGEGTGIVHEAHLPVSGAIEVKVGQGDLPLGGVWAEADGASDPRGQLGERRSAFQRGRGHCD